MWNHLVCGLYTKKMEREIKAIIEEKFKKFKKEKKELKIRLMYDKMEEESLEATYDKIMSDKIVNEQLDRKNKQRNA